jgi:DNA-binding MarR family transcriptional regulator
MELHQENDNTPPECPVAAVRKIIRARRSRAETLGPDLFDGPAWDMLLELYASTLEQRQMSVMDVAAAACVPGSTALRWLAKILNDGLAIRRGDETDGRRSWVELTTRGLSTMERIVTQSPEVGAL